MPGEVKRKFYNELMQEVKKINKIVKNFAEYLPWEYNEKTIVDFFKKYYPEEWDYLTKMAKTYKQKDLFLLNQKKKKRYFISKPEDIVNSKRCICIKNILLPKVKELHKKYIEENYQEYIEKCQNFIIKRERTIEAHQKKLNEATKFLQEIDPYYLEAYISIYHNKNTSLEEKLEIIKELSCYSSPNISTFLQKINDVEHNDRLRRMAFEILQKRGEYIKLRRGFKGKTKEYSITNPNPIFSPEELYTKMTKENQEIQKIKKYDFFISHSYNNKNEVIELYKRLNKEGYLCYCDWSCDTTYLIRELASDYTKEILKFRISQSSKVIYLNSNKESEWITLELEYAKTINKKIYQIDISINNEMFNKNIEKLIKEIKEN